MAMMPAPEAASMPKEYEIEDRIYASVSKEAMGYVEAAQRMCGQNESQKLLEIASEAARGDDEILMELYVYGRFEFNFTPDFLSKIIMPKILDQHLFRRKAQGACTNARRYRDKKDLLNQVR